VGKNGGPGLPKSGFPVDLIRLLVNTLLYVRVCFFAMLDV
jgi:hypothetical protein